MIWGVILAIALTYLPGLFNGFVWLDQREIVEGEVIFRGGAGPLTIFTDPAVVSGYQRPLYNLIHSVDRWIWGLEPMGFHLSSLVLQLLGALLVVAVARKLGWGPTASSALGALWGLHPVNAEVVGLIHAKGDLLSADLLLLSALALERACRKEERSHVYQAMALAAFAAALLAKEVAFFAPCLAAVLSFESKADPARARVLRRYAVLGAVMSASVVIIHARTAGFPVGPASAVPLWERAATFCDVYVRYMARLVWPLDISLADTTLRASAWSRPHALAVSFAFISIAALQTWLWRRLPHVRGWIALYNLSLLPVSQLVPLLHFQSARYLYIPSLAFLGGVLDAARRLPQVHPYLVRRLYRRCAVCAVIVLYALVDRSRIQTFASDLSLFGPEVAENPDYAEGLSVLGSYYDRIGDYRRSEEYFRDAVVRRPNTISYVHHDGAILGLSRSLLAQGRPLEVSSLVNARLPEMSSKEYAEELRYNAAIAAYKLKRFREAEDALEPYGRSHPRDADCAIVTGLAAFHTGNLDLARRELQRYLALAPSAPDRAEVEDVLRLVP